MTYLDISRFLKKYLYLCFILCLAACNVSRESKVLVFTKTTGYVHESIPAGIAAIQKLGAENNFKVDTTRDASVFTEDGLSQYKAVIFLSTTGDVLNSDQQVAFERYIQAGGGFVGIHSAADTEYEWPWYGKLVGAYFKSHPHDPNVRSAVINVTDTTHQATRNLPVAWNRKDEWYNYRNIFPGIKTLATLDENSYEGGDNGDFHPIAWYHDFDGGRAFYTGGGHTNETYSEPLFLHHILGGIAYAMGDQVKLDYSKAYAVHVPDENRFAKKILANDLNEPMELAVTPDGQVFYVERNGNFYRYDPAVNAANLVWKFPVLPDTKEGFGNGLLGMTIDPDFVKNRYLYFFYTPNKLPARQNVSRFKVNEDGTLDIGSEKIIIEIPLELEVSAHTGGSLAWDKNKNLFISTGDNTVPFASEGFAPIDEIPGRIIYDAQRSAANTNDLRGKVLRIHPETDGTYTIPDGNMFAKGTPNTRPEIFVMGCRNPYRISVDPATSILYWGEIGPDSGNDGVQGPRGYDEINQAKEPGNYGWPYFVGNSKPYYDFDFKTKQVGVLFDTTAVENLSPNNTGAKKIPSPKRAMIWYPYDKSDEFTDVGIGGRSAMAGPVYHFDEKLKSAGKLPAYFDKKLFIYDWMRNWVFAVQLNEDQSYKRMEPFMAVTGDFRRPIDMELGPDGTIYMLEYGSVYGIDNIDARLVHITFNEGNRAPKSRIAVNDSIGLSPLKVSFKSKSFDFDEGDKLSYRWSVDGATFNSEQFEYTFSKNGFFKAILTVTDPHGAASTDTTKIYVGNTRPTVDIVTAYNPTFFFGSTSLNYKVVVKDQEDPAINSQGLKVTLNYVPKYNEVTMGHQQISSVISGKLLMANSDCKACHQLDAKSVGPSFIEVARRYKSKKGAEAQLAEKIIKGGGGVWGDHSMSAHPQISTSDATEIVKYILSLSNEENAGLPPQGSVQFTKHKDTDTQGRYFLNASYKDEGGASVPLEGSDVIMLRPARVQAEDADTYRNLWRGEKEMMGIHNRSYFVFKNINLSNVKSVTYRYSSEQRDGIIEIHTGSPRGPVISSLNYKNSGSWSNYREISTSISDPGGNNDLYIVFRKDEAPNRDLINVDWLEFKLR
jgi:cytochrome c